MASASIFSAILDLRREFRRHGYQHPVAILLGSMEDGMRLRGELLGRKDFIQFAPGDREMGVPVEAPDGSVWMEMEIAGVKVRWPAKKLARPDGGFAWV